MMSLRVKIRPFQSTLHKGHLPLPQCNTACDLDTKVSPLTRAIIVSAPSIFSLKIQAYGITDDLNWIKHFLRDRHQCRQIGQYC